jgi:hypothetical protein
VGKPAGKILPGRPTYGWKNNIKIDFREDVVIYMELIGLRKATSGGLL